MNTNTGITSKVSLILWTGLFMLTGCTAGPETVFEAGDESQWMAATAERQGTEVRSNRYDGGNFDVLGDGALLLSKKDTTRGFWHSSTFVDSGRWASKWMESDRALNSLAVNAGIKVYGQPQDMTSGWTKFEGNPLISPKGWKFAAEQSLQLPDTLKGNDQSLVRGTGKYEGKWVLYFNVGGWAIGGWAMAVADSLSPLKRGENPFRLVDPYPVHGGAAGEHAPNDWIEVNGTWYAPDESRDHRSRMWSSPDMLEWENKGPIQGLIGHDPGMVWDGERFYLFTEDGNRLQYASTTDPLGPWEAHGVALEVGDHTGDADLSYFNNAWHMFFDDAPHLDYTIGYASTTPEEFPTGWQLHNDVFGPRNPDQGQQWDEPGEAGNNFGTGDADLAVEDHTLYITYERPVGIAWKELDLSDDLEQTIEARFEYDINADGSVNEVTDWKPLDISKPVAYFANPPEGRYRVALRMATENQRESPMIDWLEVKIRH